MEDTTNKVRHTVILDRPLLRDIKAEAKSRDVSMSLLIRQWSREGLAASRRQRKPTQASA